MGREVGKSPECVLNIDVNTANMSHCVGMDFSENARRVHVFGKARVKGCNYGRMPCIEEKVIRIDGKICMKRCIHTDIHKQVDAINAYSRSISNKFVCGVTFSGAQ